MDSDHEVLIPYQSQLCPECEEMDPESMFIEESSARRNVGKLLSNLSCPLCLFLVQCIAQDSSLEKVFIRPEDASIRIKSEDIWGYSADSGTHSVRWLTLTDDTDRFFDDRIYGCNIQQLHKPLPGLITDADSYLRGRVVSQNLDLRLIRHWMDRCTGYGESVGHQDCIPRATALKVPSLLIEIASKTIIPAPPNSKYAALSYVWGGSNVPQLHHKDLVCGEKSLFLEDYWEKVPQTIKDAILLCELLSIPFLWADALCIEEYLRDSLSNGSTELAEQMSIIYGGAYVTIVAAAGDNSWAGLAGIRHGSRTVRQKTACVNGMILASVQPSPRDVMRASTWNSRAWTFQEGFLSHRLLIFTENQVLWNCNSNQCCEDICWEDEPYDVDHSWDNRASAREFLEVKRDLYTVSLPQYEVFRTYTRLVEDYTARKLTYQQDALDAFTGVLAWLRETLSTTFFFAIPFRFFEQCLLFDTGCFVPRARRNCFPSWSWVDWNQENLEPNSICFPKWHGTRRNMEWSLKDFQTLISWYICDGHQGDLGYRFKLIEGIDKYSAEGPAESTALRYCSLPENINSSHVLLFEASTAHLQVNLTPFMASHPTLSNRFTVHLPGLAATESPSISSIGSLMLDSKWRRDVSETVEFEFIAIAKETREIVQLRYDDPREDETKDIMHTLMIITDSRGISQRIQVFSLDEADWIKAKPTQRTVYLI